MAGASMVSYGCPRRAAVVLMNMGPELLLPVSFGLTYLLLHRSGTGYMSLHFGRRKRRG
jgi:hypothetical protein